MFVEPDKGNIAPGGFINNTSGRRPEPGIFPDLAHGLYIFFKVIISSGGQCFSNPYCGPCSIKPCIFFLVIKDHVVDSFPFSFTSCSSETTIHTGKRLDLEGNVFDHMSHPCAFIYTRKETATYTFAAAMT